MFTSITTGNFGFKFNPDLTCSSMVDKKFKPSLRITGLRISINELRNGVKNKTMFNVIYNLQMNEMIVYQMWRTVCKTILNLLFTATIQLNIPVLCWNVKKCHRKFCLWISYFDFSCFDFSCFLRISSFAKFSEFFWFARPFSRLNFNI